MHAVSSFFQGSKLIWGGHCDPEKIINITTKEKLLSVRKPLQKRDQLGVKECEPLARCSGGGYQLTDTQAGHLPVYIVADNDEFVT